MYYSLYICLSMNDDNDGKTFPKINFVASACTFQLTDFPFTYIGLKQEGGSVSYFLSFFGIEGQ